MVDKDPEVFWREILSGDPHRVRETLGQLSVADRQPVEVHLKRMISEPGWSEGQRRRARSALDAMDWEVD